MATPTDDRRDLLTVIVHMRAKPGREQELRDELTALVEPTSQEEGFVNYDLHVSLEDPAVFFLYENWESGEALDAHFQTPHLQRFVGLTDELLDGGLHLTRLRRIA
jgi:quinol monooxygenase YgiN